jgi:hypothetical protein
MARRLPTGLRTWLAPSETYTAAQGSTTCVHDAAAQDRRPLLADALGLGTTKTPISFAALGSAPAPPTLARAGAAELGGRHRRDVLAMVLRDDDTRAEHGRGDSIGAACSH